jgi:DNA-binding MarR family transcriptional regulator
MKSESADLTQLSEIGGLCPVFNIRAASRIITQLFDEELKPSGLQITQFAVLVGIASAESPTMNQLAQGMVMDRTTLTRNLKPIEAQGLIRIKKGEDKRTSNIELTAKGKAALQKTLPYWEKARAKVSDELGSKFVQGLLRDLSFVRTIKVKE